MWARMSMQRTWRAWLNDHLLQRWLASSRFYKLELIGGDHKNPEHRINDDLRIAADMPVDFVTGFVTSLLSAGTFIAVLWMVGGSFTLETGGLSLTIPGFLGNRGARLCAGCQRIDAGDRVPLHSVDRAEEPGRGRIPICADARAGKCRKHCRCSEERRPNRPGSDEASAPWSHAGVT